MFDVFASGTRIYQWIDAFTTVASFLTVIFSGYAAVVLWKRRREFLSSKGKVATNTGMAERFEFHRTSRSSNPHVLSINLLDTQATCIPDIELFYKAQGGTLPPVNEISIGGIKDPAKDLDALLTRLQAERVRLDASAATEVHLFFAGPLAAALHVGAALDNWRVVKLYQMDRLTKQYEFWGAL